MSVDVRELYRDSSWGWYDYQPMLDAFGNIAIQVDESGYQGDSRLLYDENGKIGYLIFGWGSCSGCDALQACNSLEDVQELCDKMQGDIKWFDSKKEALEWFKTHDWEGDYSWYMEETKEFVRKCIEYLQGGRRMTEAEIMKALECHKSRKISKCGDCPYLNIYGCAYQLSEEALDLLNRKNAENERLCGEIDELIIAKDQLFDEAEALIKKARAEAIKEFAEKVKEAPIKCGLPLLGLRTKDEIEEYFNGIMLQVCDAIDQIAKEMGVEL